MLLASGPVSVGRALGKAARMCALRSSANRSACGLGMRLLSQSTAGAIRSGSCRCVTHQNCNPPRSVCSKDGTIAVPWPASTSASIACGDELSKKTFGATPAERQTASKMLRVANPGFGNSSGCFTTCRMSMAFACAPCSDGMHAASKWKRGS